MRIEIPDVDHYLLSGCGRCAFYDTPKCKVHTWREELRLLRTLVLETGLKEEVKWGVPCYSLNDKNVVMVTSLIDYCAISFFKGSIMADPNHLLVAPGPNSQAVRLMRFTSVDQIIQNEAEVRSLLHQAIALEKDGKRVEFKKEAESIPDEFILKMEEMPELKQAFYALTPGRQRSYILHFSSTQQSKTRFDRIERCISKIMAGKGFHDY